jgi:hypothetical protein
MQPRLIDPAEEDDVWLNSNTGNDTVRRHQRDESSPLDARQGVSEAGEV